MRISPSALDDFDHRLLSALRRAPTASFADLAAQLDSAPRTVARRYHRLTSNGILRVVGRTAAASPASIAWLARLYGSPQELEKLGSQLVERKNTRWIRMAIHRGELMCGFATPAQSKEPLLDQLRTSLPFDQVETFQLLKIWGIPVANSGAFAALDATDKRILAALAVNGRASSVELAEAAHVDQATAYRRRKKLVESGILYFEADIPRQATTHIADAMAWFKVAPGHIAALGDALSASGSTQFVAATTGRFQLVANLWADSQTELFSFLDSLAGFHIVDTELVPMGPSFKQVPF
ncbi:Lrp/AsnC family transcriptional regulator [Corynebacterium sp. 32222D000AT]|uniref:Lrp/AsnC family transcriptional regulator n=1 Tax=unclassified Corynebacterium TaxID=2624378 RepID=UPI002A9E0D79|nr:AsnC family transcriptional regulator [Mycobacteriaceae bacterium]MDY5829913.1 AsnC family transcriptional regulator [Corynebacterium sp.]